MGWRSVGAGLGWVGASARGSVGRVNGSESGLLGLPGREALSWLNGALCPNSVNGDAGLATEGSA